MRVRHFFTAWARNLAATRLLSAIAIFGLALGLAGAILVALAARIPLGYNAHVPDNDRAYLAVSVMSGPGMAADYQPLTPGAAAALIRANVAEVDAAARVAEGEVELRRGREAQRATIYWADPDFFRLLRLPAVGGDPASALGSPDGLVMTETAALTHFGRADALGEAILVDGQPMVLRAVIADFPAGRTDLESGVFASGLARQSVLAGLQADGAGEFSISARTYLRLRPGTSPAEVERRIAPAIAGLLPPPLRSAYRIELVRIDTLALHHAFHPGARQRLVTGSLVAALVLFIAAVNFVNLSVALSARRRREIAVRKASGASRGHIAAQFLGEAVLTVLVAGLLALALSEWLLPNVNGLLGTEARLDYRGEPLLLLWLLLGALLLGLLAGAWPALILARLRPADILKDKVGARGSGSRSRIVCSALVTGQFAILIGLVIATVVVQQQRRFAMDEALRVDVDQMLTVAAPCLPAFVREVARLRGVRGVSCSGREWLTGDVFAFVDWRGGRVSADIVSTLPSAFALYGLQPLAGTLAALPAEGEESASRIVVNEAAARRSGFASPSAAIGEVLPVPPDAPGADVRARIVAVVPDFALTSIETPIEPTIYLDRPHGPGGEGIVSVKLAGRELPETLAAIDRLWRATGNAGAIERAFVSDHLERLYGNLERSGRLFAIFALVAIFLACLGLAALSLAAAERRTKEIGIRKAMGASSRQILTLLLWQLSRPVLLANLVAWPLAWLAMQRWLNGFAYRVSLDLWLFPAAGLLALAIALLSVGALIWRVARRKPVHALRYE